MQRWLEYDEGEGSCVEIMCRYSKWDAIESPPSPPFLLCVCVLLRLLLRVVEEGVQSYANNCLQRYFEKTPCRFC